ncbi:hypothetical protein ACW9I7_08980, partial [Pseudomonas gingeri]
MPAMNGNAAYLIHPGTSIASKPAPTGSCRTPACGRHPTVGAGLPAMNGNAAYLIHPGTSIASKPAPTGS